MTNTSLCTSGFGCSPIFMLSQMKNATLFVLTLLLLLGSAQAGRAATSDLSVFRPSNGTWYTRTSAEDGAFSAIRWGLASDVLVPADYDGDGIVDAAVWRAENGTWYIQRSSDAKAFFIKWGSTAVHPTGELPDVPVAADYDGDRKADIAIWRPDTGQWFILSSARGYDPASAIIVNWGKLGDVPVQQDYDGDGRDDVAIFRPTGNAWYILRSSTDSWEVHTFGLAGRDMLVPADYTGDGKADIAVFRSGTWFVLNSSTGETEPFEFGHPDAMPVPADYDGDGITDFAVYRKGVWHVYDSGTPRLRSMNFGTAGDVPLNSLAAKRSIVAIP